MMISLFCSPTSSSGYMKIGEIEGVQKDASTVVSVDTSLLIVQAR